MIGTIFFCLAYAHIKVLQVFRPVFVWLAQGMANINEVVDWMLVPLAAILHFGRNGLHLVFPPTKSEVDN